MELIKSYFSIKKMNIPTPTIQNKALSFFLILYLCILFISYGKQYLGKTENIKANKGKIIYTVSPTRGSISTDTANVYIFPAANHSLAKFNIFLTVPNIS